MRGPLGPEWFDHNTLGGFTHLVVRVKNPSYEGPKSFWLYMDNLFYGKQESDKSEKPKHLPPTLSVQFMSW